MIKVERDVVLVCRFTLLHLPTADPCEGADSNAFSQTWTAIMSSHP